MLNIRKPSPDVIRRFLARQDALNFTYDAVGASATTPPAGFVVDRTRAVFAGGSEVFNRAEAALRQWRQFDLGWVQAFPNDTPLEPGRAVAILGRAMGTWWLNACRIVYVIDEAGPPARFGFAYGTLPGHAESGEERFLIEWNPADDVVTYDILAFSRRRRLSVRLAYPLMRRLQRRFGRDSVASMRRAVSEGA